MDVYEHGRKNDKLFPQLLEDARKLGLVVYEQSGKILLMPHSQQRKVLKEQAYYENQIKNGHCPMSFGEERCDGGCATCGLDQVELHPAKEDSCYRCGSDDIEFGDARTTGDGGTTLYECNQCGAVGIQHYHEVCDTNIRYEEGN